MSMLTDSFGAALRNCSHSLSLYAASRMKMAAGTLVQKISSALLPWLYTALTPLR